jgi:YidC/Oxa1 family membrane protein insertase
LISTICITSLPYGSAAQRYLFSGPAALIDGKLEEVKPGDLEEASKTLKGNILWAAYEGTYFMTGVIPEQNEGISLKLSAEGEKVRSLLIGAEDVIPANGHLQYNYQVYFGPKKMETLKEAGHDLERIVNFGWFDKLAKPALFLLNFFYGYVGNYGIAIILVTILIKLLFWPIAQKGLKSMKNMQKIQPKMAKLKEKYKDDKTRLNEEMMILYKTYKVNPVGGCLPMMMQIPVFFALYKVLLQAIELRHAPFMLWITDLSAPDRLFIGIDLPYLGGLPVLTLLMGASMFLQQKMTPAPADPTQAKIMMFLPVIFTFMFLNFASGLVLYWFVNNLLSIAQQYLINKKAADA